jgi:SIR2-like domain
MTLEASDPDTYGKDYERIAKCIRSGDMVPFFGAGASADCGLPTGGELTAMLREASNFPEERRRFDDLALVASYFQLKEQTSELRGAVKQAVTGKVSSPGAVHELLARQTKLSLYVTTNYDNLIEAALEKNGRPAHVVVDCKNPQKVWLRRASDTKWTMEKSETLAVDPNYPTVLKLHGGFDPGIADSEFGEDIIITEEDYVAFLGRPKGGFAPAALVNRMSRKSLLFLGYGLKDWNVRVLLSAMGAQRPEGTKVNSWAVVLNPKGPEEELWGQRGVKLCNVKLNTFAERLEGALAALPER